jgi:hypothetical protein
MGNRHAWLGTHEHENGSWLDGMTETLIACGNGCTDMRKAHFHIKFKKMGLFANMSERFEI